MGDAVQAGTTPGRSVSGCPRPAERCPGDRRLAWADVTPADTPPPALEAVPTPGAVLAGLKHLMELKELPPTQDGDSRFLGNRNARYPLPRVFGGQVLGQSLMAAAHTVPEDRAMHSMHGYFLRAGEGSLPIEFSVERLRDGRSYSARRVLASQNGRPIAMMSASFQVEEEGLEHQEPMPQVTPPEGLPTTAQILGHIDHPTAQYWSHERPFDVRHVDEPIYLVPAATPSPAGAVWMKAVAPLPDSPVLHRALLAYAADYTMLEPILRRHGRSWVSKQDMASLDHSMWWHRPARVDEWLLYVLHTPSAQGGRGLGTGREFNRDGALVATIAQEGMVRLRDTALVEMQDGGNAR